MSDVDVYQIDYDDDLIQHLAIPESVQALWLEGVKPELFSDVASEIYTWQLEHLKEHKAPATASVLAEEFDLDFQEPLTAIGDLIERARERWIRKNIKQKIGPVTDAFQEDPLKVPGALLEAYKSISTMVRTGSDSIGTGEFEKVLNRYEHQAAKGMGPSLGFAQMDDHFYGLRGVSFLIGAPKSGKSWMATNCQMENVLRGANVWQYALELPIEEAEARLLHMTAGVPWWKFIHSKLTEKDKQLLREASEYLDECGYHKILKPASGGRTVDEMVRRAQDAGADLVIIDQLQYVEGDSGQALGGAKPQEYWPVLNRLRDLSDEIPVLVVHQFNRSVMGADEMPEMQQAKGASSIEEVATLALGIYANKHMRASNILEVGTLASRNASWASWEIGTNFSKSCELTLNGEN